MNEQLAIAVFAAVFLAPIAIFILGRLSSRFSAVSYRVLGITCLATASIFFVFVGWYFLETGNLIAPRKYGPAVIVPSDASIAAKVFAGAIAAGAGGLLALVGASLLKQRPRPHNHG